MAVFTNGNTMGVTKQQFLAATCIFNGKNAREAAREVFDCRSDDDPTMDDPLKVEHNARTIRKWMKEPRFQECYRSLVREFAMSVVGSSINRIAKQVNDENAWLANKASNDVLNRFYAAVMGEDDKEMHIIVEGMPEMGEPDAE